MTIGEPSDFYSSLTIRTERGAVVQVIYRLACDTNFVGEDCATDCLQQPDLQVCSTQARYGLGGDRNHNASEQALRYFGSPLARCPLRPFRPKSTVSPTEPEGFPSPVATPSETLLPTKTLSPGDKSATPGLSSDGPGGSTTNLPSYETPP
ncbi:hypothetical protein EGW08_012254, partial [Elysia chlorotica]